MKKLESEFYRVLNNRCGSIRFVRVENALGSGFPDAVAMHRGLVALVELKVEYQGGWFYVRNTQHSFAAAALLKSNVDISFVVGTLDNGFWYLRFSELMELPFQDWKLSHKRYNTKDLVSAPFAEFIPNKSVWNEHLTRLLFTSP